MRLSAKREDAVHAAPEILTVLFEDVAVDAPPQVRHPVGYQFSEWSKQFCETANEDVVLLAQETIGILQRNMNGRFNFLIKLTRAKSPVEVLGLQTTYWRNQKALRGLP